MERNAERELSCIWYSCKYCKKNFPSRISVALHKKKFHKYEMLMAKGIKCVYNFDDGVVIFPARQNPNPNPNPNLRKTSVSSLPLPLQSIKTSQQKQLLQHLQQSQVPRQPASPLVISPSRSLSPLRTDFDFRSCDQSRSPNSDIFRRETFCTLRRTNSNDTDATAMISTDEGEGELSIDCEELATNTETEIITELNSALLHQHQHPDQHQKEITSFSPKPKPRESVITFQKNTKKGNEISVVVGNDIRRIRQNHNPPDPENFTTAATGTGTDTGTAPANVQQSRRRAENAKKNISEITNRYGTTETKSSTRTPTLSPADRKEANEEAPNPDPDLDALEIRSSASASASLSIATKPAKKNETETGTGTGTERTNSKSSSVLPIPTISPSSIISPNNHHRHLPCSLQNPGNRKTFIKNEVTFYLASDDSGHSGDGDGDGGEGSGEARNFTESSNANDYNMFEDSNERENRNTKKISTTCHTPLLPDPVPVPVPVQLHPIPAQGNNNNVCKEQFPRQQKGNSSRRRSNTMPPSTHARMWDAPALLQNYPRLELEIEMNNEMEMDVEEEFSCDLCPRTFKKMGSLRRHKYSHYRHNVRSNAEGHRQNTEWPIRSADLGQQQHQQRVYANPPRNQSQHQNQRRSNNTFGDNRNQNQSHCTPIVSRSPCPRINFRQESLASLIKKGGKKTIQNYEPPARRDRGVGGVMDVMVDAAGREMEFEIEKLIRKENNLLEEMTEHARARELADKLIHISKKQPPPPQSYPCLLCRLPFQSKDSLAQHLEFHMQPAESSESETEPPPTPPTAPPAKPNNYVCQICAGSFSSSSHFEDHKKGGKCWTNHTCAFCFLHFPSQDVLTTHERSHGGAKPFLCKFCNADFESVGRLMSHLVSHSGLSGAKIL